MKFSFCESVHAGSTSPWHIRKLTDVGRKLGGGIDTASLCGRVDKGWDLEVEITEHHLTHTCAACAEAYRDNRDVNPVAIFEEQVYDSIARYGRNKLASIVKRVSGPGVGAAYLEALRIKHGTMPSRAVDKVLQHMRKAGRIEYVNAREGWRVKS